VRAVLNDVGAAGVPMLDVFNKIDLVDEAALTALKKAHPDALWISAAHDIGRADLVAAMTTRLELDRERVRFAFDDRRERDRRMLADLYRHARVISHESERDRVSVEADVPRRFLSRFAGKKVPA
jgi:GTP-binding protein HflX